MYADGEGEAPKEIKLYDQCHQWRTLPKAGGILDQPYGLLERMESAHNVYTAIQAYNAADNKAAWMDEYPDGARIVALYWELRDGTIEPTNSDNSPQ